MVLLRFAEALVGGLELPDFELLNGRRRTDGKGIQVGLSDIIIVGRYHGLSAVGEDFNKIFVDKDAQLHILALGKVGDGERRFGGTDPQRAVFRPKQNWEAASFAIGEQGEAKELPLNLIAGNSDAEFDGVAVQAGDLFASGRGAGDHFLSEFADLDVAECDGLVAQRFKFSQGLDAEDTIGGKAQFTR